MVHAILSYLFNAIPIRINDQPEEDGNGNHLLVLASVLNRMPLGMKPYWGREALPLHMTAIRESPEKLCSSFLLVLLGRGINLTETSGYLSRNLDKLELTFAGDYIIDGEIYCSNTDDGPLKITTDEAITVLSI